MKLLITGFEPFGSSQINPSEQVVLALAEKEFEGIELVNAILPVERFAGPDTLLRTFISAQPDVVLCLGEAGGNAAFHVERVAVNLLDFLISDNGGHLITDKPIIKDGPDAYMTTLPTRELVQALVDNNVPARLSYSAGTFLCNEVFYEMLHYLKKHNLAVPAGFVHLPQLPDQVAHLFPPRPSMSLDTMIKGVSIIIQTLAAHFHNENNASVNN